MTKPNIILCMTDDQGWGDVSYNGMTRVKTPNLDAMAAAVGPKTRMVAITQMSNVLGTVTDIAAISALAHAGVAERFSYISTAGGAFLEWLEGNPLPGVEALKA